MLIQRSYNRDAPRLNYMALDRLGQCLEENNCAPGSDTVIVLVSHHFGECALALRHGMQCPTAGLLADRRSAKPYRMERRRRDLVGRSSRSSNGT